MKVQVDKDGNNFVIGENGQRVVIAASAIPIVEKQKKLVRIFGFQYLKRAAKDPSIFKDESGNEFIYSKTGKKIVVEKTKDGKPFYRDEKGNVVMVNKADQPKLQIDEQGNL